MCAEAIADEHQHVVNVEGRQLMCVCRGCYLLFTDTARAAALSGRPRPLPGFPDFALDRRQWEALQIPVGLAFFFRTRRWTGRWRSIPGPPAPPNPNWTSTAWNDIAAADPRVDVLADDIEALLVRVPDDEDAPPAVAFWCPIDACYEFVGRLRMLWRGFDGGQQVRRFIDEFFAMSTRAADEVTTR